MKKETICLFILNYLIYFLYNKVWDIFLHVWKFNKQLQNWRNKNLEIETFIAFRPSFGIKLFADHCHLRFLEEYLV